MSETLVASKTQVVVFCMLVVLTLMNVGISFVQLGVWNSIIALAIGTLEALLVILYFMDLPRSSRVAWLAAMAGFAWLALLMGSVLSDVWTRP